MITIGAKPKKAKANVLPRPKPDRRLLSHVPDPEALRANGDRRESGETDRSRFAVYAGQRYESGFPVTVTYRGEGGKSVRLGGVCIDISQTGMRLVFGDGDFAALKKLEPMREETVFTLRFKPTPGTLGEGMEKRVVIASTMIRADGEASAVGFQFAEKLYGYFRRRSDVFAFSMAAFMLFFLSFVVVMMRYSSFVYIRFATALSVYSIITAAFLLTRYLFGALYKPAPIDPTFHPGVTVVIPCFNEERWIGRTILSCVNQDYPVDSLEVIVVDDCSSDRSYEAAENMVARIHQESARFRTKERVRLIRLPQNGGKREALAAGVRLSTKEMVAFVDSDSFLEPDAIKNLVQPFFDPEVHGVSGRTDVANTFTNSLTKMQAVRYYIAFRMMKAAESLFDSVLCLSGPLSCYRKETVLENLDAWLGQKFFGMRATFGDDRSLTQMVLRHHRTVYQDTAICQTVVPHKTRTLLRQQMRWKRSWLRESLLAARFMWRKEPFMALSFYAGLLVPIAAPLIVLYNMVYLPLTARVFPFTFLFGMLCMALLMSFAQLILRKSSLWLFGLWFCVFYEAVLLWQMPWAWVTFWFSTWGTRMTPADVAASKKRGLWRRAKADPAGEQAPGDKKND